MERIGTENIHMTKGHYFPSKQLGQYLGFSQLGILVSQNLHIITEDLYMPMIISSMKSFSRQICLAANFIFCI